MPYLEDCEVALHQQAAPGHFRLVLNAPRIASEAKAGQFCMIEVQEGYYPFLRRPMCFERIFTGGISILYKIEGEGTRLLSRLVPGQSIGVQGPLGRPFPLEQGHDRHIIIAGGIGVAPFPALAEAIIAELGAAPEVILAARNKALLLCEEEFHQMGCKIHLVTDDGSSGRKGFASDMLKDLAPGPGAQVYACGPMPMLKATHAACQELAVPCLASLEAEMACGDGVCLGCVVEAEVEIEAERMVRVCCDGPVFDTKLIHWEAY